MFKSLLEKISALTQDVDEDKILPIEIFVRHCHYSTVSAHKERLPNFSRERCLENLLATACDEQINITFFLDTAHPMQEKHFLHKQSQFPVIEFEAGSEAASFLHMLEYVYQKDYPSNTIIYFLEDDYIHRPHWPKVLREAFTIPGIDYVTLFDHKDKILFPSVRRIKIEDFSY